MTRSLTRLEQGGLWALILVVGITAYLHLVYPEAGRRLERVKKDWVQKSAEVDRLKRDQRNGRVERVVRRLKKKVQKAEEALREAETALATEEEKDLLATRTLQLAAEEGLRIQEYSRIKESGTIRDLAKGPEDLQNACYRIILEGRFNRTRTFLSRLHDLPRLITLRRLHMEVGENGRVVKTEVWICL